MIHITFPNGDVKEFSPGITPLEIARSISEGLARKSLGALHNGALVGLDRGLTEDGTLRILTDKDPESLELLRHTAAHVLAQAVKRHHPSVQLGFGPAIEDGFYYDFLADQPFTPEDLAIFEKEIKEIAKENLPLTCTVVSKDEAIKRLKAIGDHLKVAHVEELDQQEYSFYSQGDFADLCRGPHLPSTGLLKHIKLINASGAYWKGDEKNPMLQRIYGTAFFSKEALEAHLTFLEEAKKRDHRVIGKELDLFMFSEEAGAGFAFFKPRGATVINLVKKFIEGELVRRGYSLVQTPHLFKAELFETSGHLGHYAENMFMAKHSSEDQQYVVKPMNCPGHIQIYKSAMRSYRELPIRYFEFGTCYRFERSGTLHGLTRVRNLTIDDAHHFMTPDQLEGELLGLMDFAHYVFTTLGYEYKVKLATRSDDFIGTIENWDAATLALEKALAKIGWDYEIDPGGGAFYGPKVDIFVKDAIGRTWQHSTIQVDFNLAERFNLEYIDETGVRRRPNIVHRAILGSLERFMGVFIEHTAGAFPVWMAPEQARVIPISEKTTDYAVKVAKELHDAGFRVTADLQNEKIGFKIRDGRMMKVPYLLVVGPDEAEAGTVSVNERGVGDTGAVTIAEFKARLELEGRIPSSGI
jgi:threonyl-tRNA synthetase